jgi:hypothetical protein
MRWMSNIFRLAMLEEIDDQLIDIGRDPRHQSEIRRLRRMSMTPSAGRFYPVGDDSPDRGRTILPEEARQLVDLWRSRQTIGPYEDDRYDDISSATSPLPVLNAVEGVPHPSTLEYDDDYDETDTDDEDIDDVDDELEDDDSQAWSEAEYSFTRHKPGRAEAPSGISAMSAVDRTPSSHRPYIDHQEEEEPAAHWAAGLTAWAAIMLLAVLLGTVAGRFINAYISPPQQPAEVELLGPTKIVPSAVPLENSANEAAGRLTEFSADAFRPLHSSKGTFRPPD